MAKSLEDQSLINKLIKEGWEHQKFRIEIDYLKTLSLDFIIKETNTLAYDVAQNVFSPNRHFITNMLSVFSDEVEYTYRRYVLAMTPNPVKHNTSNEYNINNNLFKKSRLI